MKLWIDSLRPAPNDEYIWVDTVNKAKNMIMYFEDAGNKVKLINLDYCAGNYAADGGDYIKLLDWLEETGRNYPICIHSACLVDAANMRRIIERNGWTEVK